MPAIFLVVDKREHFERVFEFFECVAVTFLIGERRRKTFFDYVEASRKIFSALARDGVADVTPVVVVAAFDNETLLGKRRGDEREVGFCDTQNVLYVARTAVVRNEVQHFGFKAQSVFALSGNVLAHASPSRRDAKIDNSFGYFFQSGKPPLTWADGDALAYRLIIPVKAAIVKSIRQTLSDFALNR